MFELKLTLKKKKCQPCSQNKNTCWKTDVQSLAWGASNCHCFPVQSPPQEDRPLDWKVAEKMCMHDSAAARHPSEKEEEKKWREYRRGMTEWRKKVKLSRISAKTESLFSARFGWTSDWECCENFCCRLSSVNWTQTSLVRATTLGHTVASRAEWEKSKRSGLADTGIRDSLTFFSQSSLLECLFFTAICTVHKDELAWRYKKWPH